MTRPKNSASASAHVFKRWLLVILLVLLAGAGPVCAAAEASAPAPPLKTVTRLAVIDVQRILQESLAARSVQKQLETQRAKFQAEISSREQELHAANEELKAARDKAGDAAAQAGLEQREQQLRERFIAIERDVQGKRHALDEAFAGSMGVVRSSLLQVVQELAAEQGVAAVLLKPQLLWHDPALDLTSTVLQRLNERLQNVPVKIEPPPAIAADPVPNSPPPTQK